MRNTEGSKAVGKEVRQQALLEELRAVGDEAITDGRISAYISASKLLRAVDVLEAQVHDEVRATLLDKKGAVLMLDPKALTELRDVAQARVDIAAYSTALSGMLGRFDKN